MKRQFTIISFILAVMAFTACQKDDNGLISLNVRLDNYATNGNTKMYVDNNNYTHWISGDQVNINGKNTTCSVDLTGAKAKITGVQTSTNGYIAIYPAGIAGTFTATYSTVNVTLPSTQIYSKDVSGNQIIKAPMCAYCSKEDNTLTFRNLCSLLEVTVNNNRNEDITMQNITVTSNSEKLSGAGTINVINTGSNSHSLSMGSSSSSYNYVTLDFSNASETVSRNTSKSYYIVVPAFSENDISISIVATSTGTLELTKTTSDVVLSANKIVQGPTLSLGGLAFIGTEENPYKINNLDDLVAFRTKVNSGTTYEGLFVKLMANINCGDSWTPIGTSSNNFKGTFDGNDKTITYSISTNSTYQGLFGYIQNATIKNLNVDATISQGGGDYTGSIGCIVARQEGGTITGCTATGNISSTSSYLGGIVGRTYGSTAYTISNCTTSVNITSSRSNNNYIGGILGYIYTTGTITNCSASGNIYAPEATGTYVGGIVGYTISSPSITYCNFTGHVRGSGYVGMIAANKSNNTTISNCTYSSATAGVYKGVGIYGNQTGNDTGCTPVNDAE